jgi:cytochrome c554/c'-like protein
MTTGSSAPVSAPAFAAAGVVLVALLAGSAMLWAQMATPDRVQESGFWPTQGTAARKDFLGPAACARCHPSHAATQAGTSMARTAMHARDAPALRDNPSLRMRAGTYSYEITTSGGQSLYAVSGPGGTSSVPLEWAFGAGKVGQTYLFEKDGLMQEARLSYFSGLHGADFTPARAIAAPRDVAEAASRPVPDAEAQRCFACHTTASTAGGVFDRASLIPGITCEACHGPGRNHAELAERRRLAPALAAILRPASLDPAASVDFCGACHATFWDVKLAGAQGIAALRSQPNRLQSSRCWGEGDARITCVACHDPHEPLVLSAARYDSRCLACHVQQAAAGAGPSKPTRAHPGRACPVGRESCVTCHMPKYDVPGMHHQFTDHLIRVVGPKRPAR